MSRRSLAASLIIAGLAVLCVVAGVVGASNLSQPTSRTTTTSARYSSSIVPVLNVSLRPNQLYATRNLTDPSVIFANITTGLSLSASYQFSASQAMPVSGSLSAEATFFSGTSPEWSKVVLDVGRPLAFNSSTASVGMGVPLDLPKILNLSLAIDQELNLAPGAGALEVNTSFEVAVPGSVAENQSSIDLSFAYAPTLGGAIVPTAYTSIEVSRPVPATSTAVLTTRRTSPLAANTGAGEVDLGVSGVAIVAAGVVGWRYLPRRRPTALERFLSENADGVIRVRADTRPAAKAVAVTDLGELVKLANVTGQPIFLFESDQGALLYVVQADSTFAFSFPSESPTKGTDT